MQYNPITDSAVSLVLFSVTDITETVKVTKYRYKVKRTKWKKNYQKRNVHKNDAKIN